MEYSNNNHEVKIQISNKRLIIPVFINRKEPYNLLLDTGCVHCEVSTEVAKTLQLERADVPNKEECYISVVELGIGETRWRDLVYVWDRPKLSMYAQTQVDGMLGYYFIRDFLVTINYSKETIVLEELPDLEKKRSLSDQELVKLHVDEIMDLVKNWDIRKNEQIKWSKENQEIKERQGVYKTKLQIRNRLPLVSVFINGAGPYQFIFDMGAGCCSVSPAVAETLHLEHSENNVVHSEEKYFNLEKVAVGGAQLRNLLVYIRDCSDSDDYTGTKIDGILGYNFLKEFRITIDYQGQNIVLE